MARKNRRIKVTKRRGWRRAKRRTVKRKQKTQFPLTPQMAIPEELASSPARLFGAPECQHSLSDLLALAWHQAITEGLTLSIGASQVAILDELAGHTRGLIIYNIGTTEQSLRDNVVTLAGPFTQVITELLERRYEHVSFVYLTKYVCEVLPLLASRLVPGSIVVLSGDVVADFHTWADENSREVYALSRIACDAVVVMLAN